jgi:hypothetical protein
MNNKLNKWLLLTGYITILTITSCSSNSWQIAHNESKLATLPERTQIAVILEGPLTLFAVAAIL